jgi:hypothetical protein
MHAVDQTPDSKSIRRTAYPNRLLAARRRASAEWPFFAVAAVGAISPRLGFGVVKSMEAPLL